MLLLIKKKHKVAKANSLQPSTFNLSFSRGFSLLEIVLALAIVTIGIVGIMIIFPAGLRARQRAADFTTAATLGHQRLQETMARGHSALEPGLPPREGSFEYHPNFWWRETFIQHGPPPALVQVTVEIYWIDGVERREKNFVTFVAP